MPFFITCSVRWEYYFWLNSLFEPLVHGLVHHIGVSLLRESKAYCRDSSIRKRGRSYDFLRKRLVEVGMLDSVFVFLYSYIFIILYFCIYRFRLGKEAGSCSVSHLFFAFLAQSHITPPFFVKIH